MDAPIRIVHFADLHLGVENYSHPDPNTGFSTCFGDFLATFDEVLDFAQAWEADIVLFCGDAYKNREPSQTQQREFARRVNWLAQKGIPVLLLLGNHDLPHAFWRANAVEIFNTLSINNVIVADHPAIYPIKTKKGLVQIAALPWLRRSLLLNRDEIGQLSFEEIKQRQAEKIAQIVRDLAREVDPATPAILAAHLSLSNAALSSEQAMRLGQEPLLAPSELANPIFDYVALGHIHKNQVLAYSPPLVYSGSLQRLDFSDEEDIKGFYSVELKSKRDVDFEFHSVKARLFKTIRVDISPQDLNPTSTIVQTIAGIKAEIKGAIVRIQIKIPQSSEGLVQEAEIHRALKEAQYVSIIKEVIKEHRLRLRESSVEAIKPLEALEAYLKLKQMPPQKAKTLVEYGAGLIQGTGGMPVP